MLNHKNTNQTRGVPHCEHANQITSVQNRLIEDFMTQEFPENERENKSPPKVVVIGVGNLLLKDEGIGIHAIKAS